MLAMHGGVSLIAGQRHPNRFVPLCPWSPPMQTKNPPQVCRRVQQFFFLSQLLYQ
jgi:enterochelin esterase-like enzyme